VRQLLCIALLLFSSLAIAQPENHREIFVHVTLTGAETVPQDVKDLVVREMREKVTAISQLKDELRERITDVFQRHGYFKAEVGDPKLGHIDRTTPVPIIEVQVSVRENAIHHLDSITFAHNAVFDSGTLRDLIPLRDGELFNVEKMRAGIKALRDLYGSKGYVNFTPIPDTFIDDEQHTIRVDFQLDEGEQYRVGKLTLSGIEPYPGAGKELLEAWKSVEGRVYTSQTWEQLLLTFSRKLGKDINGLVSEVKQSTSDISQHNDTRTIDYHLDFPDPK
jgi:outer membrane protein assembly factor BamA